MATTISEATSRIRNQIKAVKQDPFLTDRFIYKLLLKYSRNLIKRIEGSRNQMVKFANLFVALPCIPLCKVDKVEACCLNVGTDIIIKRTERKIPNVYEALFGPLIRRVSSVDGSVEVFPTNPTTYTSMTKSTSFKYNKNKYYWFLNGYLYFPDINWEQVEVEGIFADDISSFFNKKGECTLRQDQLMPVPDFLFAEVEALVIRDLTQTVQLPSDINVDKINPLR